MSDIRVCRLQRFEPDDAPAVRDMSPDDRARTVLTPYQQVMYGFRKRHLETLCSAHGDRTASERNQILHTVIDNLLRDH